MSLTKYNIFRKISEGGAFLICGSQSEFDDCTKFEAHRSNSFMEKEGMHFSSSVQILH